MARLTRENAFLEALSYRRWLSVGVLTLEDTQTSEIGERALQLLDSRRTSNIGLGCTSLSLLLQTAHFVCGEKVMKVKTVLARRLSFSCGVCPEQTTPTA